MVDQPIENAGPSEGTPMVKTQPSGSDILAGISVDQANYLLTLSAPAAGSDQIRQFMINMGMVGWLLPNGNGVLDPWCIWPFGQSLLRTTYALLFNRYGTRWGAVDGAHFNVPDLRGRGMFGWDNGAGVLSWGNPGSGG